MKIQPSEFPQILDKLKAANTLRDEMWKQQAGRGVANALRQFISPPQAMTDVPSLMKDVFCLTRPMLKIRFQYAGRWENAVFGNTLLGLSDMKHVWDDSRVMEQVQIRKDNWGTSPPANYPLSQISLLGVNARECEEIYLVWEDATEPRVVSYAGNYEYSFTSVADCLLFYAKVD